MKVDGGKNRNDEGVSTGKDSYKVSVLDLPNQRLSILLQELATCNAEAGLSYDGVKRIIRFLLNKGNWDKELQLGEVLARLCTTEGRLWNARKDS